MKRNLEAEPKIPEAEPASIPRSQDFCFKVSQRFAVKGDCARHRFFKSPFGYSLLEFTGVLAVILPVIFGAIDVNNALQAYTALQESTNIGLRCLYTTDQGCVDPTTFRAGTRQYDWYLDRSTTRNFVRQFAYSGDGYWLSRPQYTFDSYQVTTVGSANYSLPRTNYWINTIEYTRNADLRYIVRTHVNPWVTGTNPRYPQFRLNPGEGSYPGTTVALPSNRIVTPTNSVTVNLALSRSNFSPSTPSGTVCFESVNNSSQPNFSQECEPSLAGNRSTDLVERAAQVVIWVEASARGTGNGKVAMRVNNIGSYMNATQRDLGGQYFAGSGNSAWIDANFYPRGTTRTRIDTDNLGDQAEWNHSYIAIPFRGTNNPVRLEFIRDNSMPWDPGVEFRIDAVHIYPSLFDVQTTPGGCRVDGCDYTGQTTCGLSGPSSNPVYEGSPNPLQPGFQALNAPTLAAHRGAVANLGALYSDQHFQSEFSPYRRAEPFRNTCDFEINSAPAVPEAINQPCPSNFGATNDSQRASVCPIQNQSITRYGATPQQVTYSDTTFTVPRNATERAAGNWDFTWTMNSCTSQITFTPPSSLAPYRVIQTPTLANANQNRTTWLPFGLGDTDPRVAKNSDPAYQCGAIRLNSMHFDGHDGNPQPSNLPHTSLFSGARAELVTSDDNCYRDRLKAEAIQYGLPGYAFFEPHSSYLNEVQGNPTGSCVVTRSETLLESRELVAQNVTEGTVPEACLSGGCASVVSNVIPGTDHGASMNLTGALYRAQQELSHAYPRALDTGCAAGDANCATFTPDTSDAGQIMSWTSAMKVPMNLLGGTPITISYTGRRTQERRFAE